MDIETPDFRISLLRLENGRVEVAGGRIDLQIFRDTMELCGLEEGDTMVFRSDAIEVSEGSIAEWLQFEALNYL